MTTPNFKGLDVSEQLAQNGLASRAREARDNKVFVNSLFKEIEILKEQNLRLLADMAEVKYLLREAQGEKKPKKASLLTDKAD